VGPRLGRRPQLLPPRKLQGFKLPRPLCLPLSLQLRLCLL
jgi:hypothetical protein